MEVMQESCSRIKDTVCFITSVSAGDATCDIHPSWLHPHLSAVISVSTCIRKPNTSVWLQPDQPIAWRSRSARCTAVLHPPSSSSSSHGRCHCTIHSTRPRKKKKNFTQNSSHDHFKPSSSSLPGSGASSVSPAGKSNRPWCGKPSRLDGKFPPVRLETSVPGLKCAAPRAAWAPPQRCCCCCCCLSDGGWQRWLQCFPPAFLPPSSSSPLLSLSTPRHHTLFAYSYICSSNAMGPSVQTLFRLLFPFFFFQNRALI